MTMFTRTARLLAASTFALAAATFAMPAAADATPAANYSDMWYLPSESGWGISFVQHTSNRVYAVWYTYDPRVNASPPDPASNFVPLWIVLAGGGSWTTPNTYTGPVYVTNGVPFNQSGSSTTVTPVGTFTFTFTDANNGTFAYNIAPPAGLASTDPAFGLPSFSGTKNITRNAF
jgi:hypothetical protein